MLAQNGTIVKDTDAVILWSSLVRYVHVDKAVRSMSLGQAIATER